MHSNYRGQLEQKIEAAYMRYAEIKTAFAEKTISRKMRGGIHKNLLTVRCVNCDWTVAAFTVADLAAYAKAHDLIGQREGGCTGCLRIK